MAKNTNAPKNADTVEITRSLGGQRIPEEYRGKQISYTGGTTLAKALELGHFEDEAAVIKFAYNSKNIYASARITELANEGATLEQIQAEVNGQKMTATPATRTMSPETREKAKATRAAKDEKVSQMEALLAKAQDNPELRAQMEAMGISI